MKKRIGTGILLFLCLWVFWTFVLPGITGQSSLGSVSVSAAVKYKKTLLRKNGKTYYYNAKGKKVKNCWKTINGKRYHFGKTGAADTGFVTIGGKRYCFTGKGVMRTGWYVRGSKTYYFHRTTGVMMTGWRKIHGKLYYFFDSDGVMVKNYWIGTRYVGSDGAYRASKKSTIGNLKAEMESAIASYSGTWSVYVKNLDTGEAFSINNQSMSSASLIKLYAMGAAFEKISEGELTENSLWSTICSMITVSSNDAFNTVVRTIGLTSVNEWCKKNGYTQTNQGKGIYDSSLSNGSGRNLTSVEDCGKFLESLYRGTCVNRTYSEKMLEILKQQTRRSKIPAGVPDGTTVANKTGETDDYTHDAAIVYSGGATYIICVMGWAPGGAWYAARNITSLSRLAYNYFN